MDEPDPLLNTGTGNLARKTIRSGGWVLGSHFIRRVISLFIMAVLARLLTPADYGLIGMVFVFISFLNLFVDMGLGVAVVQKASLTHGQLSTLFWFNLLLGVFFGTVVVIAAPLLVWFYGEKRLLLITMLFALGFPIGALGAMHGAVLQRRMEFGKLSIASIFSMIAGGATGIVMALRGYGVHALVAQQLVDKAVNVALMMILAGWMPGLPSMGTGVRKMAAFGGLLTVYRLITYPTRAMADMLLGKIWGAAALGLYTKAYVLMLYPKSLISMPINWVVLPALSKLQDNPEHLRKAYFKVLQLLTLVISPILLGFFVSADDVVRLLLGVQWMAAVPIFRVLCVVGLLHGVFTLFDQVYIAKGRVDIALGLGVATLILLVPAFCVGVRWGSCGVAWSYLVVSVLMIVPCIILISRIVGVKVWENVKFIARPLAASAIMAAAVWYLRGELPEGWSRYVKIATYVTAGAGVYCAAVALLCWSMVKETVFWGLKVLRSKG